MSLPGSFSRDFPPPPVKRRFRRIMIGIEGRGNTGKTELALSAPGPGLAIAMDRNHEGVMDNPRPPTTRNKDFLWVPVEAPLPGQLATAKDYLPHWQAFYGQYRKALDNADARTVILDGDSDSFELQIMAEFGRTDKIMPRSRGPINAARRAMYARAYDSGKFFIATNKLKRKYEQQYDANGQPVKDNTGENLREWDGVSYERQGFGDYEYLWALQLRTMYDHEAKSFGLQILMCKADRQLEGEELWGKECNLPTLLESVYPNVPLSEWGY